MPISSHSQNRRRHNHSPVNTPADRPRRTNPDATASRSTAFAMPPATLPHLPARPVPPLPNSLLSVSPEPRPELPLSSDMDFLKQAVERVVAGIYLLAGSPGSGKSTAAVQAALDLGRGGLRSLLIATEQSRTDLQQLAGRLTADWDTADAGRAVGSVQIEDRLYDVSGLPALVTREVLRPGGMYYGVRLLVLDSVQGHGLAPNATKTYSAVLEAARLCSGAGIAVFLVNHVTRRGDIAGPQALEHGAEVTLLMRKAGRYSLLAVRKNRFGPTLPRPLPLAFDKATKRLGLAPHARAEPGAAWACGGPDCGLLQIQASVGIPAERQRGSVTAPGLPKREVEQLIDLVSGIEGLDLSGLEHRIHCRLPGSGRYLPHLALPLCMALVASYARLPIPPHHAYVGEVDLFRRVLPAPAGILQSLAAAVEAGEVLLPLTLFAPPSAQQDLPCGSKLLKFVPCPTLEEAVDRTWPELR